MFWITVAVVCLLFWYFVIKDEKNPLDDLPGPPRLPVIGNTLGIIKIKPDELFTAINKFTELYGERYVFKVFKLRILHINSPSDVEVVLSNTRNISKSKPYEFLSAWLGNGLLLNTGISWHRRRKILTPTFHFNILKNFSMAIEENCQKLVEKLKKYDKKEVDIMPVILDFTLSVICETAMGTQLNSDKSQAIMEYKDAILNMGLIMIRRLTRIWMHSDLVFWNLPIGRRFRKSQHTAVNFAEKVIRDRRKQRQLSKTCEVESEVLGTKKRMAMLDLLLEAEANGEIDSEGILDEVNTFMFAGHDTTAMALTFCLMMIADHEEVQERVFEECQRILGNEEAPTLTHLADLKYLEAVIKETLRIYPSVPFIGRVVEEDFMLGDLLVKKGTELSLHIYQLHRREELFPEPMAFKPERFLEGSMTHPYAFVPFSAGPRNCIVVTQVPVPLWDISGFAVPLASQTFIGDGQRFAMQEMKHALAEICRNFILVPKENGWRPQLTAEMVLRPTDPIYIRFIPRDV